MRCWRRCALLLACQIVSIEHPQRRRALFVA
jgi:hypothetical protein